MTSEKMQGFVDCSFTKCELDHTMLNESSATVAGHPLH